MILTKGDDCPYVRAKKKDGGKPQKVGGDYCRDDCHRVWATAVGKKPPCVFEGEHSYEPKEES